MSTVMQILVITLSTISIIMNAFVIHEILKRSK